MKPPVGTPLDRGHPLYRYIRAAYAMNDHGGGMSSSYVGAFVDATGRFPGYGGAGSPAGNTGCLWRGGARGPVMYHDNSGTGVGDSSYAACIGAHPALQTWSVLIRKYMTSGGGEFFGNASGSGHILLRTSGTNQFQLVEPGFVAYADSTLAWTVDAWNDFGVTYQEGSGCAYYLNGQAAGTDATTSTWQAQTQTSIGGANGMYTEYCVIFDGIAIGAAQMIDLMQKPYDLWAPPVWRRYFVPQAPATKAPPPWMHPTRLIRRRSYL